MLDPNTGYDEPMFNDKTNNNYTFVHQAKLVLGFAIFQPPKPKYQHQKGKCLSIVALLIRLKDIPILTAIKRKK